MGLRAEQIVGARQVYGGPAAGQVEAQLRAAREATAAQRKWVEEYAGRLPTLERVSVGA